MAKRLFNDEERKTMSLSEQLQGMYQGIIWHYETIDAMNLKDKEIFVVIGATRVGKGTLLEAVSGKKMKYWKTDTNQDEYEEEND